MGAAKSRRVNPGDFILSNSMSFGRPYISKIAGYVHDGWIVMSNFKNSLVADYLYHVLLTDAVQRQFETKAESSSVSNLNIDRVRTVVIPVPEVDVQKNISNLLDTFEIMTNDLKNGLPAEIEARRKQYEHYREKLLTFKELAS